MYFIDGKESTIVKLIVGTGGVTKGHLCVLSSNTVVLAAAAATDATVLGIAAETAVQGALASIELCGDRIIRSEYAGTASNLATCKEFDLTDSNTVNINDTTGGIFLCVGYNTTNTTIDGIITAVHRAV